MTNLQGGYHRDYQLLKEVLFPAVTNLLDAIRITLHGIDGLTVRSDWSDDERYRYLQTVEDVNRLVTEGLPFRDAYRQVADAIAAGTWRPPTSPEYTHTGSIGNPAIEQIKGLFAEEMGRIVDR